jgi:hypothetical protein
MLIKQKMMSVNAARAAIFRSLRWPKWMQSFCGGPPVCGSRKRNGGENESGVHRDHGNGEPCFMSSAVLSVLLAIVVAATVFLVVWWLVRKL